MTALFDVWCAFTPRIRVICWSLWTLALGIIAVCWLLAANPTGDDAFSQLRAANNRLWLSLYQTVKTIRAPAEVSTPRPLPFTPLSLQMPNVQLLRWQPSTIGGELTVTASWEAIPPLFSWLAQRGMVVHEFSLHMEKHQLELTLALETLHEE